MEVKSNSVPQGLLDFALYLKGILLKFPFAKSKKDDICMARMLIIKFFIKILPAQKKLLEVIRLQDITDMYLHS